MKSRIFISVMLALMLIAVFMPTIFANSAEPPGLTVIVCFPPNDLNLSIRFADGGTTEAVQLNKEKKAWETYYRFFYAMVSATRPTLDGAVIVAESEEYKFETLLPEGAFDRYNNLATLNIADGSIKIGQSLVRSILLISMRVILTLIIEGLIFFAFGYRKKASWIAFFVINLITQGLLNIALSGPNLGSYWIFGFAFFEIIIFIAEVTAFSLILRERKKGQAAVYALLANLVSLIIGSILISYLPV